MSLPDGEYDLDVSILLNGSKSPSLKKNESVRSSSSKRIRLYPRDGDLASLERASQPVNNTTTEKVSGDMEFSLLFIDRKKLLKLDLVRATCANGSRNGSRKPSPTKNRDVKQESPKRKYEQALEKDSLSSPPKRGSGVTAKKVTTGNTMKWNPKTDPLRKSRVLSPRPRPASRPRKSGVSESDLENSDRSGNSSPLKRSFSTAVKEMVTAPKEQTKEPDHQTEDLDDDFKDLEDQLQELLGEEDTVESKSKNVETLKHEIALPNGNHHDESSDSDADDGDYENVRFQNIQFENNTSPKKVKRFAVASNAQKPLSLREFVGRGKAVKDAGSSSEED
ncbi:hypothetical protein I9W82_002634 [Candida metapsilosis]|uniref:Transcription elongation factor Eaf N-terminal domain-containing protein n=1 Tax=Candida metapsilosis TaxID=273372 RepID=A0A8H7ZJV5_9ASCO|nr:hypothetical protein I9W82_002634 [Candida metapsilosis]